jgi:hypothetical protein
VVSSEGQRERGSGLEGQRRAIAAACRRRGWQPLERVEDGFSAKDVNRPGLEQALRVLETGEAKALVAANQVGLSHALLELAGLIATAQTRILSVQAGLSARRVGSRVVWARPTRSAHGPGRPGARRSQPSSTLLPAHD